MEQSGAGKPFDLNQNMEIARGYHQRGDLANAAAIYHRVLAIQPRNAVLLNLLGLVANQMGKDSEAVDYYQRAISAKPDFSTAYNNLGSTFKRLGHLAEAIKHFKKAAALEPDSADIHFNLGSAYFTLNDQDASISHLKKAVRLRPEYLLAHYNLATLLVDRGNIDDAKEHMQRVLEIDPANEEARHVINALEHKNTERAPSAFVRRLFDLYADAFDEHLVRKLEYQIPELLVGEITSLLESEPERKLDVLDLGCGTGLFGLAVKTISRRLIGVDVSPRMVAKAQARSVYDEVMQTDLLPYLQETQPEQFDLVAAADVFIYFGNLSPLYEHAHRVLRSGGIFAFSVEGDAVQQENFVLKETGRYSHSESYILRLSDRHGFRLNLIKPVSIRKQQGLPTEGYSVVMTKT